MKAVASPHLHTDIDEEPCTWYIGASWLLDYFSERTSDLPSAVFVLEIACITTPGELQRP